MSTMWVPGLMQGDILWWRPAGQSITATKNYQYEVLTNRWGETRELDILGPLPNKYSCLATGLDAWGQWADGGQIVFLVEQRGTDGSYCIAVAKHNGDINIRPIPWRTDKNHHYFLDNDHYLAYVGTEDECRAVLESVVDTIVAFERRTVTPYLIGLQDNKRQLIRDED